MSAVTDWRALRVLITGGHGFLGKHLVSALRARGADPVPVGRVDADLCDRAATQALFADVRPDVVVHSAVEGGGIGWMRNHPVESGLNSTRMNINALEAAHAVNARCFVGVSSAWVYPRDC